MTSSENLETHRRLSSRQDFYPLVNILLAVVGGNDCPIS